MTSEWYVVKRNWPQTEARCPNYAGLGGDVWPLNDERDVRAAKLHSEMLRRRRHVALGEYEELLCVDLPIAEEYFDEVSGRQGGQVWLLRVSAAEPGSLRLSGFDVGFPSGGFSIVETELVTQSLAGPGLNEWALFETFADSIDYLGRRDKDESIEQVDGLSVVNIGVIRRA